MPGDSLRRLIKAVFGRLGYGIIHFSLLDFAACERFLKLFFEEIRPGMVLDVGANCGQYRDFLRKRIGYVGSGISFEPVPEFFLELQRSTDGDLEWEARQIALGERTGDVQFNVMGEFSSLLTPSIAETRLFEASNQPERVIQIPLSTLDLQVVSRGVPIFLKLDTQGNDLGVLRGASRVLEDVVAIQTEIAFSPVYEGQPTASAHLEFMHDLGFVLAGVYRVNMAGYPRRMVDADAVFLRRDLAP